MPNATKEDYGKSPTSSFGDTGEVRNPLPTLAATVSPCRHFHLEDVLATLVCPRSRSSTADATTQPEQAPMDRELKEGGQGGGTSSKGLRETSDGVAAVTCSVQLVAKGASQTQDHACQTAIFLSGTANIDKTSKFAAIIKVEEDCRRDRFHHLSCLHGGEDHPRPSLADRGRRVHQAMAHVRGAAIETLHGTAPARAATSCAGAFPRAQPSSPSAHRSSSWQFQAHAAGITRAALQRALKSPEENGGGSTDLHDEAQLCTVIDELRSVYERTESSWEQGGEQRRAGLRGRCDDFRASDCRTCHSAGEVHLSGSPAQLR